MCKKEESILVQVANKVLLTHLWYPVELLFLQSSTPVTGPPSSCIPWVFVSLTYLSLRECSNQTKCLSAMLPTRRLTTF